ncbi:MAG: pilin [Patescibacteria group bacterium]
MKKNKRLIFILLVLGVVIFFAAGHSSFAADPGADKKIVNVDFPCPDKGFNLGDCQPNDSIPNYLNNIYRFAVGIAGLLALGMIVAGGVYYTVSAGSSDKQKDAKDMITSAVLGVGLLLGSYLILKTINPQIVTLDLNFTNISGGELQKITQKSSLAEQGGKDINCPDFKQIFIDPPGKTKFGDTCEYRKNILESDAKLDNSGGYYDDASWISLGLKDTPIKAGSKVWTYPYYKNDNPSLASCLIYAYREPDRNSTTTMVKMDSGAKLCPNQDQKVPTISCNSWRFTADGGLLGKDKIDITVPVTSGFNYTDPYSPPPVGSISDSNKQIVPGRDECYKNPTLCSHKLWTCVGIEFKPK